MTTSTPAALPPLHVERECWLYVHTINDNRLCVRHTSLVDIDEFPEVVSYIDAHGLTILNHFEDDDEYMIGHAVVTVYGPEGSVAA